ncbi:hypothetical protein Leryth_002125, partial [Lithospermum erythrorhizon]
TVNWCRPVEGCAVFQETHGAAKQCDDHQEILLEVLGRLCHVHNQSLLSLELKVLSIIEKRILPSPPKCKSLTLHTCIKQGDLPGILHLLKCSPHLEMLELNIASGSRERCSASRLEHLI